MNTATFSNNVRTMKGEKVELHPDVQKILGVGEDSVYYPAIYAMRDLQKAMEGAAEEVGWKSDDDVVEYIMAMRRGQNEGIC